MCLQSLQSYFTSLLLLFMSDWWGKLKDYSLRMSATHLNSVKYLNRLGKAQTCIKWDFAFTTIEGIDSYLDSYAAFMCFRDYTAKYRGNYEYVVLCCQKEHEIGCLILIIILLFRHHLHILFSYITCLEVWPSYFHSIKLYNIHKNAYEKTPKNAAFRKKKKLSFSEETAVSSTIINV